MQAAEGRGPKQVKTNNFYPVGQFKTIYGNGSQSNVNAAVPPYSPVVGSTTNSGSQWNGGLVGSAVPGLNLNINGNGSTDVSFVCSPDPLASLQDIQNLAVDLWATTTFSGVCYVQFQGSNNRTQGNTDYNASNWVTILSGTITTSGGGVTFTLNNPASSLQFPKNAYRITASGGTGIIDWAIPGLFTDYNAMGVGLNATDANGSVGQMSIQAPRSLTISGGQITSVTNGTPPYAATNNNRDYIGN